MTDLKKLIIEAKCGGECAMLKIIDQFYPYINACVRSAEFDEDVRSELILAIIEMVYRIDLSNIRLDNEYALINYICSTIHYKNIRVGKLRNKIQYSEIGYDDLEDGVLERIEYMQVESDYTDNIIIDEFMKSILTDKEYYILKKLIIDKYKAVELAESFGVTKQAITNIKRRAILKLLSHLK